MTFNEKMINRLEATFSHVCVGLDSRYNRIPEELKKDENGTILPLHEAVFRFNKEVIDATHDLAAAYKANIAFYAGFGAEGLEGLRLTNRYLAEHYADIPRIADCKRSEMGESVKMVKQEVFEWLGFDCVMVTPWFGFDTVRDYLDVPEYGVSVYVHDSNPTAVEFQELELKDGRRVYEYVTERVCTVWNTNGNVFVEAGATYPEALRRVREISGDEMVILTAGIGAQGGRAEDVIGLFGKHGKRMLVNSSRGIIFAGEEKPDYFAAVRAAAHALRDQLRELSKTK